MHSVPVQITGFSINNGSSPSLLPSQFITQETDGYVEIPPKTSFISHSFDSDRDLFYIACFYNGTTESTRFNVLSGEKYAMTTTSSTVLYHSFFHNSMPLFRLLVLPKSIFSGDKFPRTSLNNRFYKSTFIISQ